MSGLGFRVRRKTELIGLRASSPGTVWGFGIFGVLGRQVRNRSSELVFRTAEKIL